MNVDYNGGVIAVEVGDTKTTVAFYMRKAGSRHPVGSVDNRLTKYESTVFGLVRQAKRAIDVERTNERIAGQRRAALPKLLDQAFS